MTDGINTRLFLPNITKKYFKTKTFILVLFKFLNNSETIMVDQIRNVFLNFDFFNKYLNLNCKDKFESIVQTSFRFVVKMRNKWQL